jgi:hypothetical protein
VIGSSCKLDRLALTESGTESDTESESDDLLHCNPCASSITGNREPRSDLDRSFAS